MSAVDYNRLIFEISERLDKLNVGRKLIAMCRGKVAPRSEGNEQDAFSLFEELEKKGFLAPDRLDVLKDLLKGVKEWPFLEEVEKFESKRREYDVLLTQIIRELDELNDVERFVSICREKIPQERQGNIRNVRSLFKELENNNCLEINRLGILKEILAQTEKRDLLATVKEFEERRSREDKFERRKEQVADILSAARSNLTGVLTIKTVFKGIAGGIVIVSAFELLRRGSTYDQLVSAIDTCVLPAGNKLIQIAEGSVNLKVQAGSRSALDNLWRMYKNGTLKARLKALLVTDEMRKFSGGEEVDVIVTIDEEEYEKARDELTTEARGLCQTEEEWLAWEKKFAETMRPLLREFYLRKVVASSQDLMSTSLMAVRRSVEEIDDPQFSDTAERNLHLPRLLRVTLPKTFTSLRVCYLSADQDTKNQHPLFGLFLDFNDSLPNVASLHNLLCWSGIVDSLLSGRLSRHEATTNIGDIIRKESKSSEERKRLSEIFEKFSMAWERMRPFVRDRLKQDVPYLNESSPISFCLIEKRGQGAFLCAAMEILGEIQNDFLQKMLSIASTGKCSALVFLEKEEGKFSIPVVHLQEAREKEIIQYQWTDEILRHSQRSTEYGHGREIFFDLEKIEKEMAVRFLAGKSYLSTREGLQEFHFAGELFHTCGDILDDLQELIPQQPLTDVFRNSLSHQYEQSLKNVQDLLEHVEIVLCLLKRHRVGKPKDPLTEFTDKWVRGPRPFPKDLLPQPHSAIQLTHVVALYEFLEDMLAESAAKRVHDRYRVPIPEEIANEMTKGTPTSGATESHRSVLNAIAVALKRFIYRYLSSEEMKPEPAESLKECMQERSLWPIDAFKVWNPEVESPSVFIGDVFPEKLAIKHTYQVLCFYQDRLEVLEEEKHVPRNPTPKISGPSASRPRQHKNRRLFSKV